MMGREEIVQMSDRVRAKLRKHMERTRINQKDLAEIVGTSKGRFNTFLQGDSDLSLTLTLNVARALSCSVDSLIFDPPNAPLRKASEPAVVVTPEEQFVLQLARTLSEGDRTLQPAVKRLMGVPDATGLAAGKTHHPTAEDRANEPDPPQAAIHRKRKA